MSKIELSGDARRMYDALKAMCEPHDNGVYLDLAESLAEIYGARSRTACDELERAGLIVRYETYITINCNTWMED
ncbi:hypothetical protein HDG32_005532 [Paraburkholderia sp. CI2]|uniref:hypothetical protein n=1 Tax=Paraburkholderia sp. CI2 TaxID=2723093 RepID=UPI00161192AE|nr:hypothetical protein [Paraburkholderia sp. CI2]MBB5469385.1 hypothetical protein [Paraburkholderia sp. CI2]